MDTIFRPDDWRMWEYMLSALISAVEAEPGDQDRYLL